MWWEPLFWMGVVFGAGWLLGARSGRRSSGRRGYELMPLAPTALSVRFDPAEMSLEEHQYWESRCEEAGLMEQTEDDALEAVPK